MSVVLSSVLYAGQVSTYDVGEPSIALYDDLFSTVDTIGIKTGWNFIGFDNDKSFSSDSIFSDDAKVDLIWQYDNAKKTWAVYSPNSNSKKLIEQNGYTFKDTLDKSSGAWLLSKSDFEYEKTSKDHSLSNDDITLYQGWNLLSSVDNNNLNISHSIFKNNNLIWVYRENAWYLKHNLSNINTTGINELTSINKNEAFWVYNSNGLPSQEVKPTSNEVKDYWGKWLYIHDGSELYIDSTYTFDDFTVVDNNLIQIKDGSKTYNLMRASIPNAIAKGNISTLGSGLGRKLYSLEDVGGIAVIIKNIKDPNIKEELEADSQGNFATPPSLPSGIYSINIKDDSGTYQPIDKNVTIEKEVEDIGNFKLTDDINQQNFKPELILDKEFAYGDGNTYTGKIRVHNLSKVIGTGLYYNITAEDEALKSFEVEAAKGSIDVGGYKDVAISFSLNALETNSKDITVNVQINDVYGNSWLEEFDLRVYKKELSLNVSTESTAVKGYIIMPNTNDIKQVDISNGSIKLPTFDQDYELVISNPSIQDETSYSIGMNIAVDDDFIEFDYTPAHEPNNTQKDAKILYTYQREMSYLHVGDIDYWKISSSEVPLINQFSKVVSENTKIGENIGSINISSTGSTDITSFVLDGENKEYFDISNDGNVTLKSKLDYETKTYYDFNLIAKNSIGESEVVPFGIDVKNEQYEVAPTLSDATLSIDENQPIGTLVGQITVVNNGDSDIGSYIISGDDSRYFGVSKSGELYTIKVLDYESKSSYSFQAMAKNSVGEGYPVDIIVNVNNLSVETQPEPIKRPILKTGQTTSYYAGDDGDLQRGVARSYSRDDSTDIVTDHAMGLMWEDGSSIANGNWEGAKDYCSNLTLGGYTDWRLPSVDELGSIIEIDKYNPFINDIFQTIKDESYWSSSVYLGYGSSLWVCNFDKGFNGYNQDDYSSYVRCVKDLN